MPSRWSSSRATRRSRSSSPGATSVEDAEEWIAELPGKRERGELLELVIDSAEGPVGVPSLMELVARDRRAFVGTWLGRAHWGSGRTSSQRR